MTGHLTNVPADLKRIGPSASLPYFMGLSGPRVAVYADADVVALAGTGLTSNGEFKVGIVVGPRSLIAGVFQNAEATSFTPTVSDLSRVFRSFVSTD
jgi:hypothetical protein